jgi:hypothetical protein
MYEKLKMIDVIKKQAAKIEEILGKDAEQKNKFEGELNALRELISNYDENKIMQYEKENQR